MENSGQTQFKIENLLEECIRRNASDLHIQYGLPPILRIDGTLTPISGGSPLNEDTVRELVFATLDDDQQKILMKDKEFDYSFAFGDIARFRVNAFHERGKLAAAFRLIPNKIKNLWLLIASYYFYMSWNARYALLILVSTRSLLVE